MRTAPFLLAALVALSTVAADIFFLNEDDLMLVALPAGSGSGGGGGTGGGSGGGAGSSGGAGGGGGRGLAPGSVDVPCADCGSPTPSETNLPSQENPESLIFFPPEQQQASPEQQFPAPKAWANAALLALCMTFAGLLVSGVLLYDTRRERLYRRHNFSLGSAYFLSHPEIAESFAKKASRHDPVLMITYRQTQRSNTTTYWITQQPAENAINPSEIEELSAKISDFLQVHDTGVVFIDCLDLIVEGTNMQSAAELIRVIRAQLDIRFLLVATLAHTARAEPMREHMENYFDEWR